MMDISENYLHVDLDVETYGGDETICDRETVVAINSKLHERGVEIKSPFQPVDMKVNTYYTTAIPEQCIPHGTVALPEDSDVDPDDAYTWVLKESLSW